jgi:hypothetical protein
MAELTIHTRREILDLQVSKPTGDWLLEILPKLTPANEKSFTYQELKTSYEIVVQEDLEPFWYSKQAQVLRENGLLVV